MISPTTYALLLPALLAVGIPFSLITFLGKQSKLARAAAAAVCVFTGLRYIWWRWSWSMPEGQEPWQQVWAWIFLVFESLSILSSLSVYFFMSRVRSRSEVSDARQNSPLLKSPVDVFIATYNEGYEILERTLVGAQSIDHPDLRIWILDDGARDWVRDLATDFGVEYLRRVKGKHAKAGNVNNGLDHALKLGRRPQFLLLLDADFVAARQILKRTLPLFEEADIGIVQTPQHFFNPDPIQSNLLCSTTWPDEQRFFFNYLLEAKDSWGAAFCCGTSAVFRVDALEACGGMPTATVTEDMLTSFQMREFGYKTAFLNEPLSLGLAPEGLKEYISQRSRWCLGCIQQFYTRWGFLGAAKVGFANRFSSLDGIMFWSTGFAFKLMMITAPLVYWWTGTAVISSTVNDMIYWLLPYLAAGTVFMGMLAGNTVFPIMTDVTHLLAAPSIVRAVATGFIKPWGHPFKVTAKGVSTDGVTVQWSILAPFGGAAVGTALGMFINMTPYSNLNGTPGYAINIFWSLFNITVLCITCAVCVELPKRRRDERFATSEMVTLRPDGAGDGIPAQLVDISIGGAHLLTSSEHAEAGMRGTIEMDGGELIVPFETVRSMGAGERAVSFVVDDRLRRLLIRKIFTGAYTNDVHKIKIGTALMASFRKVFY